MRALRQTIFLSLMTSAVLLSQCRFVHTPEIDFPIEYQPHNIFPKKMILVNDTEFPLYVDQTPITYEEYKIYRKYGGPISHYWHYDSYNRPQQPVTGITYNQAAAFCNWRSSLQKFEPVYTLSENPDSWGYHIYQPTSGSGYRLPTSQEFEVAARGEQAYKKYPWGNEFSREWANYDTDRGLTKSEKWWRLANVNEMKPNASGIYNLSGNIWQWTQTKPHSAKLNNKKSMRTLKGGSWGSLSPDELQISNESIAAADLYNYDIGFRCVLPASVKLFENGKPVAQIQTGVPQIDRNSDYYSFDALEYNNSTEFYSSREFKQKFTSYIEERFQESIYFKISIDQQPKLNASELAELTIESSLKYRINPVFLLGIMKSESGVGTVSFPRWFNNPMAYHWGNTHMAKGAPIYNAPLGWNRKYRDLKEAFETFASGMHRQIYRNISRGSLWDFHMVYVGYQANEWMLSLARVYRDLLQVEITPNKPQRDIGRYIYLEDTKATQ